MTEKQEEHNRAIGDNNRAIGERYERIAALFLKAQGYELICTNYRCRFGEIDIVARELGQLCFVEVKYRKSDGHGMPGEAVDKRKQQRIIRASRAYLYEHRELETPIRFDVVEILGNRIRVIKDAFGATF